MTGGGGTKTGRRATMVGWAAGRLAAAAGLAAAGRAAAGVAAAGLFAAAVLGGLVWVWATAWAASIVTAPSRTTGTICFMAAP